MTVIIYIYIYIYIYKVNRKKNMFEGLFIYQSISTSIFFWMQKYFIEIILVGGIIMIDKFWFN